MVTIIKRALFPLAGIALAAVLSSAALGQPTATPTTTTTACPKASSSTGASTSNGNSGGAAPAETGGGTPAPAGTTTTAAGTSGGTTSVTCSGAKGSTATDVKATVKGATTPSGTYKTKIKSSALGGAFKGVWSIHFKSGLYIVDDKGTAVTRGKYAVKGAKITFSHESGTVACLGVGTYTFKLVGQNLKFTRVADKSCPSRVVLFGATYAPVA